MKVYVDELPKSCEDCVFSETGFVWDDEVRFCKLKPRCMNWIALSAKKRKDCTLCSLSDYTKQVRKELVQEIRNFIEKPENSIYWDCSIYVETEELRKFLDQIQGDKK